jgi:hypothetical protein
MIFTFSWSKCCYYFTTSFHNVGWLRNLTTVATKFASLSPTCPSTATELASFPIMISISLQGLQEQQQQQQQQHNQSTVLRPLCQCP